MTAAAGKVLVWLACMALLALTVGLSFAPLGRSGWPPASPSPRARPG